MSFEDLWRESANMRPAEQQAWLRRHATATIDGMGLCATMSPSPVDVGGPSGERVIFGVAEYSRDELALLDRVVAALPETNFVLRVFLMSQCVSKQELEAFVPGIGLVLQSPVVAVYSEGVLMEWGCGRAARDLLARRFRLQ